MGGILPNVFHLTLYNLNGTIKDKIKLEEEHYQV